MTGEKEIGADILIVDDNVPNLNLLGGLLRDRGYNVRAVPSGKLALQAAKTEPPELILLDINMPEMDGYQVCERLKAVPALAEVPVIFLSAREETIDKIRAFGAGGVDYITKPFQFEEVEVRVRTHVTLRRQKRQLEESYARLRDLEKLRDDLTHMIVHDMGSPLGVIGESLNAMIPSLDPNDDYVMSMSRLGMSAVQALLTMCKGLLDISRLEAGQMPVNWERAETAEMIARAVADSETQADNKSATIRMEGEGACLDVDKDLVHRILVNLLSNAFKHTPRGGTVTVRTVLVPGQVRIEVRDTGHGIPPSDHRRIFEKFAQVEAKREGRGRGYSVGLGLTFCKLAVERHGGTIGVESEEGKGSCFWFTLPAGVM